MKASARSDSQTVSSDRRKHLRSALGNAALEGIIPRPQALADLHAVVVGKLTHEEYRQRVKQRYGIQG